MFAAIDETLARLYPTRRWGERDDDGAAGVPVDVSARLTDLIAKRLGAMTLFRPGGRDEYCDYVYALCFGRQPSVLEVREAVVSPAEAWGQPDAPVPGDAPIVEELYLRVALSSLAPFAAVQQVAMQMWRAGDDVVIAEAPRTGVFDPVLLPRFQKLVAALTELEIRNLDFGDLTQPPEGFDQQPYTDRYGAPAMVANYLFYPQPCSSISTTVHVYR